MPRAVPADRLSGLSAQLSGLTAAQAAERRLRYGPNAIVEAQGEGWLAVLKDSLRDPMVWFLVGTALLFALVGERADALVLAAALLPIVGMDAWLHRRTQASVSTLAARLAATAMVERDGAIGRIAAVELVPGDLCLVGESDYFPADGVLLVGEGLQVDESALTGEAMPVRKRAAVALSADPGQQVDAQNWCAAGTRLLTGKAHLRVVYTGAETLYGQIARMAQAGPRERTSLQTAIGAMVSVLTVVAVVLCVVLALVRYIQGFGPFDALLSALTLAVAALPEEFPVVFASFLGVGVYRLARRQALVRRAVVVENIGRITCICTDKTGTLTEGQLRLSHILPAAGVDEAEALRAAATASRRESGDLLDRALLERAEPMEGERIAIFPFTEDRRRETTVLLGASGELSAAAKGAPETIIAMCALSEEERARWLAATHEFGAGGHKVIACASRCLSDWPGGEPSRDFDFLGLLAFEDAVREGVAESVANARDAGIRVIMVTGDHPVTAAAVAKEVGIGCAEPRVIDGERLSSMLSAVPANFDFDVVARAVPAHKLELVRALRGVGHIVAVTGDGVNDVPALQGADVGIAMGERGTRAAREAAAIVLLDDNFRTIVRAIAEGRRLFLNLRLSFAYLLMIHAPLVTTAAVVPLLGYPLLYLPVHVVWLELIIHPTALIAFQRSAPTNALEPANQRMGARFFDLAEWSLIGFVAIVITGVVLAGYHFALGASGDVPHARAIAMVALITASATVTLGLLGARSHAGWIVLFATVLSTTLLVQVPWASSLLHLSPLHPKDWAFAMTGGLVSGLGASAIPRFRPRRRAKVEAKSMR